MFPKVSYIITVVFISCRTLDQKFQHLSILFEITMESKVEDIFPPWLGGSSRQKSKITQVKWEEAIVFIPICHIIEKTTVITDQRDYNGEMLRVFLLCSVSHNQNQTTRSWRCNLTWMQIVPMPNMIEICSPCNIPCESRYFGVEGFYLPKMGWASGWQLPRYLGEHWLNFVEIYLWAIVDVSTWRTLRTTRHSLWGCTSVIMDFKIFYRKSGNLYDESILILEFSAIIFCRIIWSNPGGSGIMDIELSESTDTAFWSTALL